MIRLRGFLRCMDGAEVAAVTAHLPAHIAASRAEDGCLSFEITQTDDPLVFEVMESFRDQSAFTAHQTRTRQSAWWQATSHILRDFRVEELRD